MKRSLADLCENFLTCNETIHKHKNFRNVSNKVIPVCGYIYAKSGYAVDTERLQECREIVLKNAGAFSSLRGVLDEPLACTLAVSDDPDGTMKAIAAAYEKMKKKYPGSRYSALAAMLIHDISSPEELESRIARGKVIYDCLKKRHPGQVY